MMYIGSVAVSISAILIFYLLSLLLSGIFLALAMLIGLLSKTRFQALGISLIAWAWLVLFYEFMVMGASLLLSHQWMLPVLSLSILLNPVEIIRVWSILSLDGTTVFGPSLYDLTVFASGWTGQLLFIGSALLWIVVPLLLGGFILKRRIGNE